MFARASIAIRCLRYKSASETANRLAISLTFLPSKNFISNIDESPVDDIPFRICEDMPSFKNGDLSEFVKGTLAIEKLKSGDYQALAWQASETSTGALLPTKKLAELCQKYDALSIVDAITALAVVDIPFDEWGLDVMVGGSQKAFMLPAGMAFICLSAKADHADCDIKKYYFDLKAEKKANLSGSTRFSTPTTFVIGLDVVLDDMLINTGLKAHFKNIVDRAEYFRKNISLELFPKTPSPALSCLRVPEGRSASEIKKKVDQDGIMIVAGQDQIKDKVLRIGHMGSMTFEDLLKTAKSIEKFL